MRTIRRLTPIICSSLCAVQSLAGADTAYVSSPPTTIEVAVPDYVVTSQGAVDYVSIPGGQLLLVPGEPRVPFYTMSAEYPKGYCIQQVVLRERSGLRTDSGLTLPIVRAFSPPSGADTGSWYPEEDFSWRVWDNPDGSTSLVIMTFPFYYDARTGRIRYYQNYRFGVEYLHSELSLIGARTDRLAYELGAAVTFTATTRNEGRPVDASLSISMDRPNAAGPIALADHRWRQAPGDTSVSVVWTSQGAPAGDYRVRAVLRNGAGDVLGRREMEFSLGISSGEIRDFAVAPRHFRIGDVVQLSLEFVNTGSRPLQGECVFLLTGPEGTLLQSSHSLTELPPGNTASFSDTWVTTAAKKAAEYHALGWVTYSGGSAAVAPVRLSTNHVPEASFTFFPSEPVVATEVRFDASAAADPDGKLVEYQWEFGDGATALGTEADTAYVSSHAYYLPGSYQAVLTVKDNEGGTGTVTKVVEVKEQSGRD